jgi:hypothetical protein
MKLTAKVAVVLSALFSLACLSVAIHGFMSLGDITDATQRSDAVGFAWYWAFLGLVAAAFMVLGYWLVKTQQEDD